MELQFTITDFKELFMELTKSLRADSLQKWELLTKYSELCRMLQQSELTILKDITYTTWYSKFTGLKVKWFRDRWLDSKWWFTDDTMITHSWTTCTYLEQQLVHYIEFHYVLRLTLSQQLHQWTRWQRFRLEWQRTLTLWEGKKRYQFHKWFYKVLKS